MQGGGEARQQRVEPLPSWHLHQAALARPMSGVGLLVGAGGRLGMYALPRGQPCAHSWSAANALPHPQFVCLHALPAAAVGRCCPAAVGGGSSSSSDRQQQQQEPAARWQAGYSLHPNVMQCMLPHHLLLYLEGDSHAAGCNHDRAPSSEAGCWRTAGGAQAGPGWRRACCRGADDLCAHVSSPTEQFN